MIIPSQRSAGYAVIALALCWGWLNPAVCREMVWQEGEYAEATTFIPGVTRLRDGQGNGASGGCYLRLMAPAGKEGKSHTAEYVLEVKKAGTYHLWIASTPLSVGWASPYTLQWEGQTAKDLAGLKPSSASYGLKHPDNFFVWNRADVRTFDAPGSYRLTLSADRPRNGDGQIVAFIDALCLTDDAGWKPSGARPDGAPAPRAVPSGPPIWREAEAPDANNFNAHATPMLNVKGEGASGGLYLRLWTQRNAANPKTYFAEYDFDIPEAGTYILWIASTPLNAAWSSPYAVGWDGEAPTSRAGIPPTGNLFGLPGNERYFAWNRIGPRAFDRPGKHRLRIETAERRNVDERVALFIDALCLTPDPSWVPSGNRPEGSPWTGIPPAPEGVDPAAHAEAFVKSLTLRAYEIRMADTREALGDATAREVRRKLSARPLPGPDAPRPATLRFGVHGMEKPFVRAGVNDADTAPAFELLARAGVEYLRTAESCWHRLGQDPETFNFAELDHQRDQAARYGMRLMLTVGYPSRIHTRGNHHLSAAKPEVYPQYRGYLEKLFARLPRSVVHSVEVANEVDAPHTWWRGDSTPADYVNEARLTREVSKAAYPDAPVLGLGATWARFERDRERGWGRSWIEAAFDAGMDPLFDGYSLHYTWSDKNWAFADWFRAERRRRGGAPKPIHNSEESGYAMPYEVVKCFARDLYLLDMESVAYYLARDFNEAGNLLHSGLFDLNWRPKLRLLAYACAVDAMKGRDLAGMAEPAPGVEAYILKNDAAHAGRQPEYAVVLWGQGPEESTGNSLRPFTPTGKTAVGGLRGAISATTWRLDPPADADFDRTRGTLRVDDEPVVVYASAAPEWTLLTPEAWRAKREREILATPEAERRNEGMMPGNNQP